MSRQASLGEIRLERSADGRLARLKIERPPVNVLRVSDLESFAALLRDVVGADVLVLSGLPRAFSAGVDLADHAPDTAAIDRMLLAMRRVLEGLVAAPAVTVACVAGACLGGGAEIAAACDLVLVADDSRIGFPEIRVACFPPGGAVLLPVRIGEARACEWVLRGETYSGREAARIGFATRSTPADALERETGRAIEELLSRSPLALASARELLRRGRREALARDLPRAEEAYRRLTGSEQLARAVREFGKSRQSTVDSRQRKDDEGT